MRYPSPVAAFGSCSARRQIKLKRRIACQALRPAQWDMSGGGDPSIQGFATDISVNVGQVINFKINTDASAYTIDIYRMGYYAGKGARLITSIQPSAYAAAGPARLPD